MKTQDQSQQERSDETTPVTPPPFHQHEEQPGEPGKAAPQPLADRLSALGLDEETSGRVAKLAAGLDDDLLTPDLLSVIAQGVTHDADVQNADAAGYLRGRNEKIETMLHPQPEDEEVQATPVFPRYCRRSIWD